MQFNFRQGISNASVTPPFIITTGNSVNLYATSVPIVLNFAHGNSNYLFYEYYDIINAWNSLPSNTNCYIYWDLDTITAQRSFGYTLFNPFIFEAPNNPSIGQMYFDQGYTKWFEWSGVTWVEKIRIFAGMIYRGRIIPQNFLSQVNIIQICEAGKIIFDNNGNPIVIETDNGFEFLNTVNANSNQYNGLNNYKFSRVIQENGILAQNTLKYQCLGLSANGFVLVTNSSNIPVYAIAQRNGNGGENISLITDGFVEDYNYFNFNAAPGSSLYIDENSNLTTYPQSNQIYQELGYVVSPFKIYFKPSIPIFPYIRPTVTVSITPSLTPSISFTPTISPTISYTPSITATMTATVTPTQTLTPSITPTQTVTQTIRLSASLSPTITPTNSVSISLSATVTPTNTVTPSFTPTNTVTPSVTPTLTPTPSITATSTITPTNSVTPSITPSVTATASVTPSNTATVTPSTTATISLTPTSSVTPSNTATVTPSTTATISLTPTSSVTPSNTATVTPSTTATISLTPTNTVTPTVS